ncbi:RICIN domain-containing protein [Kitasatospora indigofera]|uniref:RICIN domain-containing protein n=1 Tax=Kitasatospora indigofera TaxID=67307 RepID=UPI0036853DF6
MSAGRLRLLATNRPRPTSTVLPSARASCSLCLRGAFRCPSPLGGRTVSPEPHSRSGLCPPRGRPSSHPGSATRRRSARAVTGHTPVAQWPYLNASNQQWQFNSVGNGRYHVVIASSGMCLDVSGSSQADGASVVQSPCGTRRVRAGTPGTSGTATRDCRRRTT